MASPFTSPIPYFQEQAKRLRDAAADSGDLTARQRFAAVLREPEYGLMKAQQVIAVEHGFDSWNALCAASPIQQRLAITMRKNPLLTVWGIGLTSDEWKGKTTTERQELMRSYRAELRDHHLEVQWTVEWLLANIARIKTINTRHSSYGLKHLAEPFSPKAYLTNGTFIAAAIVADYPSDLSGYNAYFGMSERSISALSKPGGGTRMRASVRTKTPTGSPSPAYAYEHHHTTQACLQGLPDTSRVGPIHTVEGGYVLREPEDDERAGLFPGAHQAVVVRGDNGSVLFTAFGWGYTGEGARGLVNLLKHLGMEESVARDFAFDDRHFPREPDESEFHGKPGFIAHWRLSVPDWTANRMPLGSESMGSLSSELLP